MLGLLQNRAELHHVLGQPLCCQEQSLPRMSVSFLVVSYIKGSLSSRMRCTCHPLACLCSSPFSWTMKMAATEANKETTRARHPG